ncbi:YDG domain-containing protein [Hymenobacter gelipurpurascens]|nr:YDG domain-containing protein [Hymenobacter gelipurpurascens]
MPAISTSGQPQSVNKTVGEAVSFSVAATGTGLTYQWYKGTPSTQNALAGATSNTYSIPSITSSNAGDYYVVVSGTCAPSVTSSAATLSINKATASVTLGSLVQTYDGNVKSATAETNAQGASTFTYTYSQGTASVAEPVDAGSYTVVGTLVNADYAGTATGTLQINPKSVTVTPKDGQSKEYGALDPAFTFDNSGSLPNTAFSGSLSRVQGNTVAGSPYAYIIGNLSAGTNYTLTLAPGASFAITAKALTPSVTVSNKVYDGNASATLATRSLIGKISGDAVSLTGGLAVFADKTVDTDKTVAVTGLELSGTDAGNYRLSSNTASATATISAKTLEIGITAADKPYDGSAAATTQATIESGLVTNDVVTVSSANGQFDDKNVGTGKSVTATVSKAGADADNYTANPTATTTASISAKALTATITASNKTYDGNATASAVGSVPAGALAAGDVVGVEVSNAYFSDKNVANNKPVTANVVLIGDAADNYSLPVATGSTTANITAATLTPTFTAKSKVYDGTTEAEILTRSLSGIISPDVVTLENGAATFATKNVGTSKMVTASGFTLGGAQADNYSLPATNPTATATITPATLTYAANDASRMYGDPNGTLTGTITGFVETETAETATTGTVSFTSVADASSPVGEYEVTGTGLEARYGNYTFGQAAGNATALAVTARPITIAANEGQTKVYGDPEPSSFTYTVSGSGLASVDAFTGTLSRAGGSNIGAYVIGKGSLSINSKTNNASTVTNYLVTYLPNNFTITPKAVTVTPAAGQGKIYGATEPALAYEPVTLVGNDAFTGNLSRGEGSQVGDYDITQGSLALSSNYALTFTPNVKFTISAKALTASIAATDKVYDGGLGATATGSVPPADVVSRDEVIVAVSNAAFASKQVGTNKTVTATVALTGAAAHNYRLSATSATANADITAKDLTASITIDNKEYDGNTAGHIATRTLDGVVTNDVVSLTGGSATFADKNVGTGKTVTTTGLGLTGADAGNYTANSTAVATADITARPLVVTATVGQGKVYGTTTDPVLAYTITTGTKISGDSFSGQLIRAEGELVNTYAISLGTLSLGSNYSLSLASGSTFAITRKPLTASIAAQNKVYDATLAAQATGSVAAADLVGNDAVSVIVTNAQFNDKQVGNSKPVTATVALSSGAISNNYSLTSGSAATTATITQAELTPSFTAASRVYNGDLATRITGRSVAGVLLTDQVVLSAGTASFSDKNVGEGKTVTGSGFSLTGTDAGNYSLAAANPTAKADITAKEMIIAISATSKPYDGNRNAAVTASIASGLVPNDAVSVSASNGLFDTKNVGAGKTVTAEVSKTGTDAGNYTANLTATTTAAITTKALTIGIAAEDKVYDGNRNAAVTASITSGLVDDDVVTVSATSGLFADKNVGPNKTVTADVSKAGADAGNYSVNLTATSTAAISTRPLAISLTATNKVYDGNTTAATSAVLASGSGLVANDVVTVSSNGGTFSDKNVAPGKTVTASVSKAGADAGNYSANTSATATAAITPKPITPVFTAQSKTYDGNTSATIQSRSLTGQISDDEVTLVGGSATFDTKDVGTNKTVTAIGLSLAGTDRDNYTASATAITKAAISAKQLTAAIAAQDKIYDGNPTASATGTVPATDLIGSETVGVTVSGAVFNNKNVADGKTVSATVALNGTAASNYSLTSTSASTTANITQKTLVLAITADNKTYDGNADATVHAAIGSGLVAGDVLTVGASNGAFNNKSVGQGKPVTANVTITGGTDSGNYSANTTASTTASITPFALVGHFTAENKTYNASTNATVLTRTLTGVIGQDVVSLTGGTATFSDKNVGAGKTVSLADAALDGTDRGNYSLSSVATTTATISRLDITGSFTASNKVYDGNTTAAVTSRTPNGVLGTDEVTLLNGTASFNTKDVASGKTVTASNMTLGGAQAGNYNLTTVNTTTADVTLRQVTVTAAANQNKVYGTDLDPTLAYTVTSGSLVAGESFSGALARVGGSTVGNYDITLGSLSLGTNYDLGLAPGATFAITAKPLVPAILASNKVYNNNTTADISSRTLTGIVGQDDVTLTGGSATFADKNVGTAKDVTASGLVLSGNTANNYTLSTTTVKTKADITALGITGAFTASNKIYNGQVNSTIASRTLAGVLSGDAVTLSGGTATFADANVGTGKSVAGTGFTLTGAQSGNYSLASVTSTIADITPLGIMPSFTAASRMYDGTTAATILSRSLTGVLTADVSNVSLTAGTANFSDANVGVDKVVTATGFTLGGTSSGNYSLTTTSATAKATITQQTANPVADTYYTGSSFFWTTGSGSSTATLNLVATIKNNLNFTGDIRTAKASFFIRTGTGTSATLTPINGAQNLPVGLVNPGDLTVGTAATNVQYSISGSAAILDIAVVVTGNYKSIDNSALDKEVTVAVPTPGGLIAGGGKFDATGTAGYIKGSSSFGFYVQYNKSLKNPQGGAEITVNSYYDRNGKETPGVPHTYKLKSNAISTLATTNPTAQFSSKANISEIVNGVAQSIEGNCTMQLDMYDGVGNPSATEKVDRLAITVYRSSGGIWFSSKWDGTKTVHRDLAPNDLVSVTGTGVATTALRTTSTSQVITLNGPATASATASNVLEIYPNPMTEQGTIHFRTLEGGKAQVYLYNSTGGLVKTLYNAEVEGGREYEVRMDGSALPNGVYFCRLITNGKVENKRITIAH